LTTARSARDRSACSGSGAQTVMNGAVSVSSYRCDRRSRALRQVDPRHLWVAQEAEDGRFQRTRDDGRRNQRPPYRGRADRLTARLPDRDVRVGRRRVAVRPADRGHPLRLPGSGPHHRRGGRAVGSAQSPRVRSENQDLHPERTRGAGWPGGEPSRSPCTFRPRYLAAESALLLGAG
jgi:hypothetical protein